MNANAGGDIAALLQRGDDYVRSGDARAAMSFYQAALKSARESRFVDADTLERLRRAQGFIQERAQEFERSVERAVEDVEPDDPVARTRLSHSLEMLKGQRQIFPQQPSVLYYPYLEQRQFFERGEFDWVPSIEAATADIRAELVAILDDAEFRPYVE
ncbi:MAG TPA: aspartyl/asparaginyl beta-hydroxylase domain-containing protein, partial [Sphingomicrobium sp.]|nr:aspartyl/asparaginyl beta-hydroxylase domain-containing protein [Sphingomicrobium sp.]